jgi:hypothetical protein
LPDAHVIRAPGEDAGKAFLVIADLFPERIGKVGCVDGDEIVDAALDLDAGESIGFGDRKRTQAYSIHQLEDGRVHADSQRQSEDRCQSKTRTLAQGTEADLQVLNGELKPRVSNGLVFGAGQVAFARG